jgi:cell shape-determining protein MreC
MMMTLHRDRRKKNFRRAYFFVLVVCLVYVLFMSPLSSSITGYSHQAAEPFWKLGAKVEEKLDPFLGYFSSRRELYLENKELKEQLDVMSAKLADRSFLRRENVFLKERLGRYEKEPERILAVVLAKPDITPYDTLILDVGYDSGVSKGDLIVFENVVLGEVTEAYHTTSKARLYSSCGERVAVFIGDNAIAAEAEGLGGGNFEIELPQNVDVSVGDSIYIPQFQPQILGIVEQINVDPNDAFEKILFRSPINPFSLRFVDIIHPSHE